MRGTNTIPKIVPIGKDAPTAEQLAARAVRKVQKIPLEVLELAERLLGDKLKIRLLEAGCGARSYAGFTRETESWGIDISDRQLARNLDIHHKILGDIQEYHLPPGHFDVVVCWDVLEHLPHPRKAFVNMFSSAAPDGLLILGFPNVASFKGLVTKFTPLWFHTFFYKRIMGYGYPFKTYLRTAVLPMRVINLAAAKGLAPVYFKTMEGTTTRVVSKRFPPLRALFWLVQFVVDCLTLGRGPNLYEDYCILVLRKRAPDRPEQRAEESRLHEREK